MANTIHGVVSTSPFLVPSNKTITSTMTLMALTFDKDIAPSTSGLFVPSDNAFDGLNGNSFPCESLCIFGISSHHSMPDFVCFGLVSGLSDVPGSPKSVVGAPFRSVARFNVCGHVGSYYRLRSRNCPRCGRECFFQSSRIFKAPRLRRPTTGWESIYPMQQPFDGLRASTVWRFTRLHDMKTLDHVKTVAALVPQKLTKAERAGD